MGPARARSSFAESRVSHPLLPLRVILDRARGGAYVSVGLTGIAVFGVFLFLTYYLQVVKGYSPVTSGLAFLPMIACILLSARTPPASCCCRGVGPRTLIVTGMVLGGGAMAYLTQLTVTSSYAVQRAAGPGGPGPGLRHDLLARHQHRHRRSRPGSDSGVASALVNTMQQVGGSIGTAALSTVALTATATYLTAAPHRTAGPGGRRGARLQRGVHGIRGAVRLRRAGGASCWCRPGAGWRSCEHGTRPSAAPAASPGLADSVPAGDGVAG